MTTSQGRWAGRLALNLAMRLITTSEGSHSGADQRTPARNPDLTSRQANAENTQTEAGKKSPKPRRAKCVRICMRITHM